MIKRLLLVIGLIAGTVVAQTTAVPIQDMLYNADNTKANGTVYITNPTFTDSTGFTHPANTIQTRVVNGTLSVSLVPTTNAITIPTPTYTVQYSMLDGPPMFSTREFWAVPPLGSGNPVCSASCTLQSVRVSPFPAISTGFSAILSGTNSTSNMLVGTGASLGPTGSGTVNANHVNGASIPTSASCTGTNSGGQLIAVSCGSGTADPGAYHAVSFSATPTFTGSSATAGTVDTFVLGQLSANVTSVTLATLTPGQKIVTDIQQASSGGPYTVTWGGSFLGACTISPFPGAHTRGVWFIASGPVAVLDAPCEADSGPGYATEFARGSVGTVPSGLDAQGVDSSSHIPYSKDSSGNYRTMVIDLAAGSIRAAGGANADDTAATAGQLETAIGMPNCAADGAHALTNPSGSMACTSITGGGGTITETKSFYPGKDQSSGDILMPNTNLQNSSTTGASNDFSWVTFNNTGTPYVVLHQLLPSTWTGTVTVSIPFFQSSGGSGNAQIALQTACTAIGGSNGPSYNTAQTITVTVPGANILAAAVESTLTMTGCSAGNDWFLKVQRPNGGGDTYGAGINIVGITFTWQHT